MRWRILKTLLHKEALRHATNRGGLVLAGLLVSASLLLAVLSPAAGEDKQAPLVGGIHHCIVWHDEKMDLASHLERNVPAGLKNNVLFRPISPNTPLDANLSFESGTGGFELRVIPGLLGQSRIRVVVRYPDSDRAGMTVYERWFWRETYRYYHVLAAQDLKKLRVDVEKEFPAAAIDENLWEQREMYQRLLERYQAHTIASQLPGPIPELDLQERAIIGGALDLRAAIATALVLFSLCFTCVYLMPSLTCEERERGLLLAQALSPATSAEILGAKFLFYPAFGIILATLLAGIHNSSVLTRPFFWMSLATLAVGTLGIGMTIACLAKTQRAASLGALCYMLAIALVLLLCQQNNLTLLPKLALEYHAPHILHATLTNQLRPEHWWNLGASAVLACAWAMAAVVLFRRRGWQ